MLKSLSRHPIPAPQNKAAAGMLVDGRMVNLAPSMAVTVEVRTGSRRIIEYVLAPPLRYKQKSLRER